MKRKSCNQDWLGYQEPAPAGGSYKTAQARLPTLLEQIAGDDHALDFAGAFVNGDDAGVAVHALDIGLTRITDAAMNLHGFVDDTIGHFAGVKFCLRSSRAHPFS